MMHLYMISESPDGPIKIGIAVNPLSRIQQLQTGNFRDLSLMGIWRMVDEDARNAEKIFLSEMKENSLGGEWLDFHPHDLLVMMPDFMASNGFQFSQVRP